MALVERRVEAEEKLDEAVSEAGNSFVMTSVRSVTPGRSDRWRASRVADFENKIEQQDNTGGDGGVNVNEDDYQVPITISPLEPVVNNNRVAENDNNNNNNINLMTSQYRYDKTFSSSSPILYKTTNFGNNAGITYPSPSSIYNSTKTMSAEQIKNLITTIDPDNKF